MPAPSLSLTVTGPRQGRGTLSVTERNTDPKKTVGQAVAIASNARVSLM